MTKKTKALFFCPACCILLLGSLATASAANEEYSVITGDYIASDPAVMKDGSIFRMFYTCLIPPSRTAICEKVSTDGIEWTNVGGAENEVQVLVGVDGEWDENLETPSIIKINDTYFLYYSGYQDNGTPANGFPASLGLAVSSDGVNFTKAGIVMTPTVNGYDNDAIYSPDIIYDDAIDVLAMVYAGHSYCTTCLTGNRILLATSTDAFNWHKSDTPLLEANSEVQWMQDGVAEPALIKIDGVYHLFFTALSGEERTIGIATSDSLGGPYALLLSYPLLTADDTGFMQVLAPTVLREDDQLHIWYSTSNETAFTISYSENNVYFDTTRPVIEEITPVPAVTSDNTPSIVLSSTEAGTATIAGSCGTTTQSITVGENTITFNELSVGSYSDCTVTVTDIANNTSTSLALSAFEIRDAPSSASRGGSSSATRTNKRVQEEKVTEKIVADTPAPDIGFINQNISFIQPQFNHSDDVHNLILFLKHYENESLALDDVYSNHVSEAVKRFQLKYRREILDVWGLDQATGYVGITTRLKINSILKGQSADCPVFVEYNGGRNGISESDEIARTKQILLAIDMYEGPIDRLWTPDLQEALITFQETFREVILDPWNIDKGTGYKYKTTNKFLNYLAGCKTGAVELEGVGVYEGI